MVEMRLAASAGTEACGRSKNGSSGQWPTAEETHLGNTNAHGILKESKD